MAGSFAAATSSCPSLAARCTCACCSGIDGYCIVMKRLEAGTFRRAVAADAADHVEIDPGELAMLLAGIDAPSLRRPAPRGCGATFDTGRERSMLRTADRHGVALGLRGRQCIDSCRHPSLHCARGRASVCGSQPFMQRASAG